MISLDQLLVDVFDIALSLKMMYILRCSRQRSPRDGCGPGDALRPVPGRPFASQATAIARFMSAA
jgi:hypothetical protein